MKTYHRTFIPFASVCWLLSLNSLQAQAFKGQVTSPYLSGEELQATIEWKTSAGKNGAVEPLTGPPYQFGVVTQFGPEDSWIEATPVVSTPLNLVPSLPTYKVDRQGNLYRMLEIHLKERKDFMVDNLQIARGRSVSSPLESLQYFDKAFGFAESNSQKLEILRSKAGVLLRLKRYEEQQGVLAEALSFLDAGSDEAVRKMYWKERFDSFLSWTKYVNFRLPDIAFGKEVMDSDPLRIAWRTYIIHLADQQVLTLNIATSEEEVTTQLLAVKARFGYH